MLIWFDVILQLSSNTRYLHSNTSCSHIQKQKRSRSTGQHGSPERGLLIVLSKQQSPKHLGLRSRTVQLRSLPGYMKYEIPLCIRRKITNALRNSTIGLMYTPGLMMKFSLGYPYTISRLPALQLTSASTMKELLSTHLPMSLTVTIQSNMYYKCLLELRTFPRS
jgi:hypothetical protein